MENKINFYVASCVPDGGVYRCELDVDGKVETKKVISAPSPMWIELAEDESLWVLKLGADYAIDPTVEGFADS